MRFRWVIYYVSPLTRWNPGAYPSEPVAQGASPWLWLARADMRSLYRRLNQTRCSCVLLEDGVEIEHHETAQPPEAAEA